MDQITDEERRRIAELVAGGAPPWKLHQEINRSRHAIRRAVVALYRRAVRLLRRPKPAKLAVCPRLREVVEGKLGAALVTAADRGLAGLGLSR
jgi:IS30 family transposase